MDFARASEGHRLLSGLAEVLALAACLRAGEHVSLQLRVPPRLSPRLGSAEKDIFFLKNLAGATQSFFFRFQHDPEELAW